MKRFWEKVYKTDHCWFWIGVTLPAGYGVFKISKPKRKQVLAHRFSYELAGGHIPKKLTIDHLCGIPGCVNPKHMEVVTRGENTLRGNSPAAISKRLTHCKWGHRLTPSNIYRPPKKPKNRNCRKCIERRWGEDAAKHLKKRQQLRRLRKKVIHDSTPLN